jgi:hypothetical protein
VKALKAADGTPLDPSCLPEYCDDPSAPYAARRAAFQKWHAAYEAFCQRREAWFEGQGLVDPESFVHLIPDEPFDPAWEVRHGYL